MDISEVMMKQYEICEEACKESGCYCPSYEGFHQTVANTPEFVRVSFFLSGWKSCQEEYDASSKQEASK